MAQSALVILLAGWVGYTIFLNRKLMQNRQRYEEFFSDSPMAMIVLDKNYRIQEWNEKADLLFGWEKSDAQGEDFLEHLVPRYEQPSVISALQEASEEGNSILKTYNMTRDATEIFCEWHFRKLKKKSGELMCMAQDITLVQKNINDLRKRSTALEKAGDAILYTDNRGIIEFANQSFFDLGLNDQNHLYGTHIGKYLFKERLAFNQILSKLDRYHSWRGTLTKSSGPDEKVLSVTITAIYHRSRLVSYVANLHDITQLSSHVDALTHRVQHDPLTGAANRATMNERLAYAIMQAEQKDEKIALFFIDLNDFKLINDNHGHDIGDRLLRDVAANLRACLRNTDTVCRYGGDEFVVIIENLKGEEHAHTVFEAIEAAISEPIRIAADLILHAKASIGMALFPDHALDVETLIKAADNAMYSIKKQKTLTEPEPALCVDSRNH